MYTASLPVLSAVAHQLNLNQEGYDIADASLLLLLGMILKRHIFFFLAKEDRVLGMQTNVPFSKELLLYSITNFKLSSQCRQSVKPYVRYLRKECSLF